MTSFDLIVIAVFILSIGFAVVRGALREIGTLAALGGAALGAYFLVKPLQGVTGTADSFIATLAIGAALMGLFFILLYFALHLGLRRVRLSAQGAQIDRIGGGIFGFARGLVLIGLGFLAYSYYLAEDRWPPAVNGAVTLPLAKGMAAFFEGFAPESTRLDAAPSEAPAGEVNDVALEGYDRGERSALSEIVATVTTSDRAASETAGENAARPARNARATATDKDPIADILKESDPE